VVPFVWIDAIVLLSFSVAAVLDTDVRWGRLRLGRPLYGLCVLVGLLAVHAVVLRDGAIPGPGWAILAFAVAYLPFLSRHFIDLETTDRLAVDEIEDVLLRNSFDELRVASGREVIRTGRRRVLLEWRSRSDGDAVVIRLDVHPSLFPITMSRPHVARIESAEHLERIREEIRDRRRGAER
jgi:hypothetical protein